jgi:hypothetical protein
MDLRRRVALTLLAALFALALPATALAAEYKVDSTADEQALSSAACLTAGGKCTLRAAMEVANATAGADQITFSSAFDGQLADAIAPATPLPAIKDPVSILGGDCFGEDGPDAPCAGIEGPSGGAALTVEGVNGVVIEGLSIAGAQIGIDVINGSDGFIARNNWIGLKLNATEDGNVTGIFLDPGSDGATIGGIAASSRNVIAGNDGDGLDLNGASHATIQGNYFGVNPPGPVGLPGGSQEMANGKDIEITDSTSGGGFKAVSNEIGLSVEAAAQTTAACDGGCNVISGASTGIDLDGNGAGQNEAPATGSTFIKGNFVGLDASGTEVIPDSLYGIYVGGSDHATVGGYSLGEANYVAGGGEGIASGSGGEDFVVRGNRIGFGSDGSNVTSPTTVGIFSLALLVDEEASIENNLLRMDGGVGIETRFLTGRITGNGVEGSLIGIRTQAGSGDGLIASNEVELPTEAGILVESPDNSVRGNFVFGSGGAGIKVRNPPGIAMTGNLIGNETEDGENVLVSNSGPAIAILEEALEPGSATEIARNRGSLNGGPFISLLSGANGGIQPPTVASGLKTSASGSADPNALVRVFGKTETAAGELHGFLAKTQADGSGNWSATYPAVVAGTLVTATQTVSGATSQLAAPVAVPADPSNGGGGNGGGGGGGTADTTPPVAKITKAPKAKSTSTTAKFKFKANEAGSTFQCKLDKGKFKNCRSPKTYKKLKPGKHIFKVRATDKAGNVSKPAKRKFTILG